MTTASSWNRVCSSSFVRVSSIAAERGRNEEALATVLGELGISDEAAWSERRARWIRDGVHEPVED